MNKYSKRLETLKNSIGLLNNRHLHKCVPHPNLAACSSAAYSLLLECHKNNGRIIELPSTENISVIHKAPIIVVACSSAAYSLCIACHKNNGRKIEFSSAEKYH